MARRERLDGALVALAFLGAALAVGGLVEGSGPLAVHTRPGIPTVASLLADPPSPFLLGLAVPLGR